MSLQPTLQSQQEPVEPLLVGAPSAVRAAALLELLLAGDPLPRLLPRLERHLDFHAAAGDADAHVSDYSALARRGRFVGFSTGRAGRYALLAPHAAGGGASGAGAAAPPAAGGEGGGAAAVAAAFEGGPRAAAAFGVILDQAVMLATLLGGPAAGPEGSPGTEAGLGHGVEGQQQQAERAQQGEGPQASLEAGGREQAGQCTSSRLPGEVCSAGVQSGDAAPPGARPPVDFAGLTQRVLAAVETVY